MRFQFNVSTFSTPQADAAPPATDDTAALLRQLLETQREQVDQLRRLNATLNSLARWQAFVARWRSELPNLAPACRQALAVLERTYGQTVLELADQLNESGDDAISTDFDLQEFVDRYGPRLAQLGQILNAVAPLADPQPPRENP